MSEMPAFWETLGFAIESRDADGSVLRMDVPAALMSPFGTVHGGIIATLVDTGLAMAIVQQLGPEDRIATTSLSVTYVSFTRSSLLRCHAEVVSLGRAVAVAEGAVYDGEGTLVAKALGNFNVKRQRPATTV